VVTNAATRVDQLLAVLRETRRVLAPGGRLAFSVWGAPQHNPWITVPASVMVEREHLARRDPDEPGMFSLREPDRIASLVTAAGFGQPVVEEMPLRYHFADRDRLWAFPSELQGPIALAIPGLDERERRAVRTAVEERSAEFASGDGYELPGLSLNVVVT
jgi:SAM-dependent methyltransferase